MKWWHMDWEEQLAIGVNAALLGLAFVSLFVYTPIILRTEQACLAEGWLDSRVTWNLERMCVREVNETEYVVTLEEARNGAEPWQ